MSEVRTLLERAAKAAGLNVLAWVAGYDDFYWQGPRDGLQIAGESGVWNPMEDDGDALRLAATVGIHLEWNRKPRTLYRTAAQASVMGHGLHALVIDYVAATPEAEAEAAAAAAREAIVRVAASYGASLP